MPRRSARPRSAEDRHAAILEAALDEFAAKGFAATRIEDVARRADVGKGTVYVHFADKEGLFEGVIRAWILPIGARIQAALEEEERPIRENLERTLLETFEALGSPRAEAVLRLVLAEGQRFPRIGDFYRREMVEPLLGKLAALLRRSAGRGELRVPAIAEYPQVLVAPLMLSFLWEALHGKAPRSEVAAMVRTHLDALFATPRER